MTSVTRDEHERVAEILGRLRDISRDRFDHEVACAEGLVVAPEYFFGPREQLRQLDRLADEYAHYAASSARHGEQPPPVLSRLQGAYGINPANATVPRAVHRIMETLNPEAMDGLRSALRPFTVFHVSCVARIGRAFASTLSFGKPPADEAHIIVVGSPDPVRDEARFTFDDGVLTLPVDDAYEWLTHKILYTATLIAPLDTVKVLAKFDDDLRMTDRREFETLKRYLLTCGAQYHGFPTAPGSRDAYWHGWHVGKCADPAHHERGYEMPLPKEYALGGGGYFLGPEAIDLLRHSFLGQRTFYDRMMGPEDALVGLVMQLHDVPLTPLNPVFIPHHAGYSGERLSLVGRSDWATFARRLTLTDPPPPPDI
jgi:hypothetical protein